MVGMQDLPAGQATHVRPRRPWTLIIIIAVFGVVEGLQLWQLYKERQDLANLQWTVAVQRHDSDNVITPDVGTIQFLRQGGYSIQLEAAQYTGDGLHLEGFVGNPTNLWLSNLSLKFSVTKNLYEYEDDFAKDQFSFFLGPRSIGEAQCSPIVSLAPGGRQRFEVTIPKVKQREEGIRIVVAFTGERYSYAP